MTLPGAMTGTLLPIWLPMVGALVVYLLRRYSTVASLIAATIASICGIWLLRYPPVGLALLERPIALSPLSQSLLVALAFWLALAFLFAGRVFQGWTLFPLLLVVLGVITSALFFQELVIQVLLLKIAWLAVIVLVQGGINSSTRAANRLLILSVLALPPFLVAALLLREQIYQPQNSALASLIVLALALGFMLMLAVLPFHAWLPQAAEDGPPLVAAWLAAGMIGSYLAVLMDLLIRFPWLVSNPQVQRLLLTAGLLLAVGAALLVITEDHLGRLWAYLTLVDLGYILLGLSFGHRAGMTAVLLAVAGRLVSLLLGGAALATIRHRAASLTFSSLEGVGSQMPLSLLSFLISALALAGAPLTPGFPGHWAVLRLVAQSGSLLLWPLLLSLLIALGGIVRALAVMTAPRPAELPTIAREPRLATLLMLGVGLLALTVALLPQTLTPLITRLLHSLVS